MKRANAFNNCIVYCVSFALLVFSVFNYVPFGVNASSSTTVGALMRHDYYPMTPTLYTSNASVSDDAFYLMNSNYLNSLYDADISSTFGDDSTFNQNYISTYNRYPLKNLDIGSHVAGNVLGVVITHYLYNYYLYVIEEISQTPTDIFVYFGHNLAITSGYYQPGSGILADKDIVIHEIKLDDYTEDGILYFSESSTREIITRDTFDIVTSSGWSQWDSNNSWFGNYDTSFNGTCVYSDFPLFMGYSRNNNYTGNYTSIDMLNRTTNLLYDKCGCPTYYSNGNTVPSDISSGLSSASEFYTDRRVIFDGFDTSPSVDTDNISTNEIGVYNVDFYPTGDFVSGNIVVQDFVPSAKATEQGNTNFRFDITWDFECNPFYTRTPQTIPIVTNWNLNNKNSAGVYEIVRNNSLTCSFYYDGSNHSYNSRDLLSEATSDKENFSYINTSSGKRSYSMYDLYSIFNALQLTDTTQSAPTTKIRQSPAVKACLVTLVITAEYGDGQKSKQVATVSYDYISGDTYKSGLTSENNNTNPDDIPEDVQDVQTGLINGANGGGGNANASVSNSPTFVNNNNPTITINNGTSFPDIDGDGEPDEVVEGSISMMFSIWNTFEFLKNWGEALQDNDFLAFLFTNPIWNYPPFNLIIPAITLIVIISIATAIIRFIRGG